LREVVRSELLRALGDASPRVRSEAALGLGRLGAGAGVHEALGRALEREQPLVRESACFALGLLGAVEAGGTFLARLRDEKEDTGVRVHAAGALGLVAGAEDVAVLAAVAGDENEKPEVRSAALVGLALSRREEAIAILYGVYASSSSAPARRALSTACIACLGGREFRFKHGDETRNVDFASELEKELMDPSAPILTRRSAALALGAIGRSPNSIRVLFEASSKDDDVGVAGFALISAALLAAPDGGGAEVLPVLRKVLESDGDRHVRGFAALAIGLSGAPEAGELLLQAFRKDPHPRSVDPVALALGWVRHGPALRDLAKEVKQPRTGSDVRAMALLSLGRIGGAQTAEFLRSCANDVRVPYIIWFASQGLAEMGDREGFDLIASLTSHKWFLARDGAYRALAAYGGRPALGVLIQALSAEKRAELRALIVHLLAEMASAPEADRMASLARLVPPSALDELRAVRTLLRRRR